MKVTAVIAEYNPFHNGHAWQLEELRRRGTTHIVTVMSPDYVQRGIPAIMEKRVRARAALLGGADLVIELPLPYGAATAERFAFGGVSLINAMGCVDELAFGAETPELSQLEQAAALLDSPALSEGLRRYLSEGRTFAQARQMAMEEMQNGQAAELLTSPNNILGIEYLRQLRITGSRVLPAALKRESVDHDSAQPLGRFASATYLRRLAEREGMQAVKPYVPDTAWKLYCEAEQQGKAPACLDRGERAILAKLRSLSPEEIAALPDLSEGIENRLAAGIGVSRSLEELTAFVKTKRYSLARVRRLILSAFLEIPRGLCFLPPPYLRVLGFTQRGTEILRRMKTEKQLPSATSLADLKNSSPQGKLFAELEAKAADLYSLFLPEIQPCGLDYTEKAVYLKGEDSR